MVTCLFHQNGMLEYWNIGVKLETTYLELLKTPSNPLLHYSTIPIGPARSCLAMAGGAKPLSSCL